MSVLSKLLKGNKKKRGKNQDVKKDMDNESKAVSLSREEMRLKNEIRKLERKEKVLLRKRKRLEERRLAVYNKERNEDKPGKELPGENMKSSVISVKKDVQEQTKEKNNDVGEEESKAKIMLMKNENSESMDYLD